MERKKSHKKLMACQFSEKSQVEAVHRMRPASPLIVIVHLHYSRCQLRTLRLLTSACVRACVWVSKTHACTFFSVADVPVNGQVTVTDSSCRRSHSSSAPFSRATNTANQGNAEGQGCTAVHVSSENTSSSRHLPHK